MVSRDEQWMAVALELARRGRGAVEPNPMVGAVLVRDGAELARGYHRRFGGPHAEIEALRAAAEAGVDPRGATMYVTLEPCRHHGKTPPCTEAIISAGVKRVVAAMQDPDEQVAGAGFECLREAGVEVTVGVCGTEAAEMLAAYVKLRTRHRPWVICKWAQTPGGLIYLGPGANRWISCEASRRRVHELRGLCDGVLVGIATVLTDDPLLTNRSGRGRSPARVVLDSSLRIAPESKLIRSTDEAPVLVATTNEAISAKASAAAVLRDSGAELLELPRTAGGVNLEALLDELGRRQWTYLLVEGGAEVLKSFVYSGLADELQAFVAPPREPVAAGELPHFDIAEVERALSLNGPEKQRVGDDMLIRYVL
ncbi:MAG: bifunctional diaminohydroxyphosphoribosylaminopyrimidine deaminase/5-amino-6-(5-phosphoribosylamino)uracil reductase RibD [Planctomycetes bacterium]|nr:bifunctional diaminohydroxyphosphoribosylaminopyrimidine deaminase/5-amino-6-(5-phosphoribosylamino)uracil reductase RibD [Planctomycetota bacterium]